MPLHGTNSSFSFQQDFHPFTNNEINPNLYHYIEKVCPCIENLRLSCVPIYVRSFKTLEDKAVKGSFNIYVHIIAQMLWTTHSTGSARAGETC